MTDPKLVPIKSPEAFELGALKAPEISFAPTVANAGEIGENPPVNTDQISANTKTIIAKDSTDRNTVSEGNPEVLSVSDKPHHNLASVLRSNRLAVSISSFVLAFGAVGTATAQEQGTTPGTTPTTTTPEQAAPATTPEQVTPLATTPAAPSETPAPAVTYQPQAPLASIPDNRPSVLSVKNYPFRSNAEVTADFDAAKNALPIESFPQSFKFFLSDETISDCGEWATVSDIKVGRATASSVQIQLRRSNDYYRKILAYNPEGTDVVPPGVVPEADDLTKRDYVVPCSGVVEQEIRAEMWGIRKVAGKKGWYKEPGSRSVKIPDYNPDIKFNKFGLAPEGLPVVKSDPLTVKLPFAKGRHASDKQKFRNVPTIVFKAKIKDPMVPSHLRKYEYNYISALDTITGASKRLKQKQVEQGRGAKNALYNKLFTRTIK